MQRPLVLLLALLVVAPAVSCRTWYMSAEGSANGTGSASDPFLTLNATLIAAKSGDTIMVAPGLYTGPENTDLHLNGITLKGQGESASDVTFRTSTFQIFYVRNYCTIENLTLDGEGSVVCDGLRLQEDVIDVTLHNVSFVGVGQFGISAGVGAPAYLTMEGCSFDEDSGTAVWIASQGLISMTVTDCVFYSSSSLYFRTGSTAAGWAVLDVENCLFQSSPVRFDNCMAATLVTFTSCRFLDAITPFESSAFYLTGIASSVVLKDCVFSGNRCSSGASSILFDCSERSSLTMSDCLFYNNSAKYSNSENVFIREAQVVISNSFFVGNVGNNVYTDPETEVTVTGSSFLLGSGGYCLQARGIATMADSRFLDNVNYVEGVDTLGGAFMSYDKAEVSRCLFAGNSATGGGAIYAQDSLLLKNCSLANNMASTGGGGAVMVSLDGSATVRASYFEGNSGGSGGGGAILAEDGSVLTISGSVFEGNDAKLGGGWCSLGSEVTASNTTLSGNSATSSGGGFTCQQGTTELSYVTFSGNEAPVGSGYECLSDCETTAVNVQMGPNDTVYGCSSDRVTMVTNVPARRPSADYDLSDILADVERCFNVVLNL